MTREVLCLILGGGRGTRLYPLTRDRAKPAVPLFGKYRLIDIPVSNCINSGFTKINILTQFNSESLNKHIARTYRFDKFTQGFVDILAADQTMEAADWFQGPADAVRRCLKHFNNPRIRDICILSGDQLYKMDLFKMFSFHRERNAEITIACNLLAPEQIAPFGIVGTDDRGRITAFVEKPRDKAQVASLAVTRDGRERFLCSMGIYFFRKETLVDVLTKNRKPDFGREIIPDSIKAHAVFAYPFDGYWRDIGTIGSFYEENLALTRPVPPLDLFEENWQIFTRSRSLPPAKMADARISSSIVCTGAIIDAATIANSIIGLRARIGRGTNIRDSIVMGADYYEPEADRPPVAMGIGEGCTIRKAILDKNVRIGDGVTIVNAQGIKETQAQQYVIRDGIVIVYKNAVIPSGTVI
ncbi:MAG: glucose-1-phosphate adenylyltransferase [Deltaproteobacteria bacterium]